MALKLGEVLNNLIKEETSKLIAEVILEADTNTVTIPNLDINRDGGVYEDSKVGKVQVAESLNVEGNYYKNGELMDLSNYQPLLISGTNIKTVNSGSLLGNGNIDLLEYASHYAWDGSRVIYNKVGSDFAYPRTVFQDTGNIRYKKGTSISDFLISRSSRVVVYYEFGQQNYVKSMIIPKIMSNFWFFDKEGTNIIYIQVDWTNRKINISPYSTDANNVAVVGYSLWV